MINVDYIRTMARYSAWQNSSILQSAGSLDDTDRCLERGAFFGSIQGTMNHLLWGDRIWMHRFADTAKPSTSSIPESIDETDGWDSYRAERLAMDATISGWAESLNPLWLEGDISWFSGAMKRDVTKSRQTLVVHLFNHGTHHRGQIHAMLTSAGCSLDDTDLPFMPD